MFPWLWFWAPHLHFPWSGDVAQRIAPNTRWLFGSISPTAGNGAIEQRVFEGVASYGRQLGILTEAVLGLAGNGQPLPPEVQDAVARLRDIQDRIEHVKHEEYSAYERQVTEWLQGLKRTNAEEYQDIRRRLLSALTE